MGINRDSCIGSSGSSERHSSHAASGTPAPLFRAPFTWTGPVSSGFEPAAAQPALPGRPQAVGRTGYSSSLPDPLPSRQRDPPSSTAARSPPLPDVAAGASLPFHDSQLLIVVAPGESRNGGSDGPKTLHRKPAGSTPVRQRHSLPAGSASCMACGNVRLETYIAGGKATVSSRPHAPLPSLRPHLCGCDRTARGGTGGYPFFPSDFHRLPRASLHCAPHPGCR